MKIRRYSIPARARQMQRTINFCYSGSSSKKQILEQNQIFKKVNRYPCTFFKNSPPKKIKRIIFYKMERKKVSQGKTPRKKDKNQIFKKSKWVPIYFFKNQKNQENYFTKWKGKKCLKVKPLNKKSRELFYKSI